MADEPVETSPPPVAGGDVPDDNWLADHWRQFLPQGGGPFTQQGVPDYVTFGQRAAGEAGLTPLERAVAADFAFHLNSVFHRQGQGYDAAAYHYSYADFIHQVHHMVSDRHGPGDHSSMNTEHPDMGPAHVLDDHFMSGYAGGMGPAEHFAQPPAARTPAGIAPEAPTPEQPPPTTTRRRRQTAPPPEQPPKVLGPPARM